MTLGLAAATVATAAVYIDEDRFFTKFTNAAYKNFCLMVAQAICFSFLLLYKWVK